METVAGSESAYCSEDECCDNSRTTCIDRFLLSPLIRREIEVDVAIIGNGPSAIFLSLLLSGYSPYFTGDHPNTILKRKLSEHPEKSLLEQVSWTYIAKYAVCGIEIMFAIIAKDSK
jgi:hypothetical protein